MTDKTDGTKHHERDRFAEKLKIYEPLRILPNNVSKANSAIIWIAAICTIGLCTLAKVKAPWYMPIILFALSTEYCLLAVWREKNGKPKQIKSARESPP